MRVRWLFALALLSLPATSSAEPPPRAGVIDRIVAVVDNNVVLMSELRARSKPYARQIQASYPNAADVGKRVLAEDQMRKQLVDKLVDELLMAQEAGRLGITVTSDEIDAALYAVASGQSLTVAQLVATAADAGLPEKDYREELGRQLLERKLIQVRFPNVPHVTSQAEYTKVLEGMTRQWMQQLRQSHHVEVRL